MDNSFLSSGKHYELLVDWEKRLKKEIPFLRKSLELESQTGTILEVASGTGRHIKELANFYTQIIGLDIEKSMIDEAKINNPQTTFICIDFMQFDSTAKFSAIFALGNAVGLIATKYDFMHIIKKFNDLLISDGILVFHLLNTEKERDSWSLPRSVQQEEGEYVFLRRFTTTKDYIQPEILTLFREKDKSEWKLVTSSRTNIPRISSSKMSSYLENASFKVLNVFGDYDMNKFTTESVDMIFVAKKK